MTAAAQHLWVVGPSRAARRAAMTAVRPDLTVSCHTRRRGPYAGIIELLNDIVPRAHRRWPDLVAHHVVELLYTVPELTGQIGPAPDTLVGTTPHEERTRYFGRHWIRANSQGVITFLIGYARLLREAEPTAAPLTLALDDLHAAEPTAQEFVALLVRRAEAGLLRVVVGTTDEPLPQELAGALARVERITAAGEPPQPSGPRELGAGSRGPRDDESLLRAYIDSDGTSDDPAELAAYAAADPAVRARLHDERADALAAGADRGLLLGAVPYHREHGSDPAGAGRAALRTALELCVAAGYSAATVDFGLRGRALCDPVEHQQDYCHFSAKAASALIPLGRLEECAELYHDLRRRYPLPRVQMTSSYALSMLYTRFFEPRDHDMALELANNGRAFASLEPDPIEAIYFQVYQDNGLALIEMHRGNPQRAFDLVDAGIQRLDREMPGDRYIVHRSQLLHNRARALVALRRYEDALADFTRLIEWDPYYVEYHTDRGNLHRRLGDLVAAIADYDRAIEVSAPFPELFYNRSELLQQVDRLDEALADLDYLLEMEPDFTEARLSRANLHLQHGRFAEALADARAGLGDRPDDPQLWCLAGLAAHELGALEEARAAYDAALASDPAYALALVNRAVLAHERGDAEAAANDLTAALQALGDDADVLCNRGIAYTDLGRYDEALADFERALAMDGADLEEIQEQRDRCLAARAEAVGPGVLA